MGRTPTSQATLAAAVVTLVLGLGAAASRCSDLEASQVQEVIAARLILVTIEQGPAGGLRRAGSTPRGYRSGRTYKVSHHASRVARKLAREYGLQAVDAWPIEILDVHCVVFEVPEVQSVGDVLESLADDSRVESAQPLQMFEVLGRIPALAGIPEADRAGASRGYDDPLLPLQSNLRSLQVEAAHHWATGAGVQVAVIDTGIDTTHPELEGRIEVARDFVGGTAQTFLPDVHGTAVAGVIASVAGNGLGIVGVAPEVRILALKACWQPEQSGAAGVCSTFTLARAVAFAIRRHSDVINLSLTGPADPLLDRILDEALQREIVVVVAADRRTDHSPGFPASKPGVIAVFATPTAERASPLSPLGVAGVGAPGVDILTIQPQGGFGFMSGSSLAAAQVSGVAALLLQLDGGMSSAEVLSLLRATTRGADETRRVPLHPVNACQALASLVEGGVCPASSQHVAAIAAIADEMEPESPASPR